MERFTMPDELAQEMCARLGVALPTDMDGVDRALPGLVRAGAVRLDQQGAGAARGRAAAGRRPGRRSASSGSSTGLGGTCWGHTVGAWPRCSRPAGVRLPGRARPVPGRRQRRLPLVPRGRGRRSPAGPRRHPRVGRSAADRGRGRGQPPGLSGGIVDDDDGRLLHSFVAHVATPTREVGRYAVLSIDLDAADLRSFCEVSRTYGMRAAEPLPPSVHRHRDDRLPPGRRRVGARAAPRRRRRRDREAPRRSRRGVRGHRATRPGALDVAVRAGLVERAADGTAFYPPRVGTEVRSGSVGSLIGLGVGGRSGSTSGTSVRARSAIEPRRNSRKRHSPAMATMAAG